MKMLNQVLPIICFLIGSSMFANAATPISSKVENSFLQENFHVNSVDDFINLSLKDLKKSRGEKITLREKIVIKIAQRQMKKQIKKGKDFSAEETFKTTEKRFSLGGFLLGFFFSLLGVLIALFFGKDAVRSAWIGFLTSLIIWGIVIIAGAA